MWFHKLANLKIPKTSIKNLMKNIHQNVIKYLIYLVLNKRKLKYKQATITPPKKEYVKLNHKAHLTKRYKILYYNSIELPC